MRQEFRRNFNSRKLWDKTDPCKRSMKSSVNSKPKELNERLRLSRLRSLIFSSKRIISFSAIQLSCKLRYRKLDASCDDKYGKSYFSSLIAWLFFRESDSRLRNDLKPIFFIKIPLSSPMPWRLWREPPSSICYSESVFFLRMWRQTSHVNFEESRLSKPSRNVSAIPGRKFLLRKQVLESALLSTLMDFVALKGPSTLMVKQQSSPDTSVRSCGFE